MAWPLARMLGGSSGNVNRSLLPAVTRSLLPESATKLLVLLFSKEKLQAVLRPRIFDCSAGAAFRCRCSDKQAGQKTAWQTPHDSVWESHISMPQSEHSPMAGCEQANPAVSARLRTSTTPHRLILQLSYDVGDKSNTVASCVCLTSCGQCPMYNLSYACIQGLVEREKALFSGRRSRWGSYGNCEFSDRHPSVCG